MSAGAGADKGRETIFAAIRAALGTRGDEPGRRGQVRARLERSPGSIIPAQARLPKPELAAQFRAMLEAQGAIVRDVASRDELPRAIADVLGEFDLPARLRHGDDTMIAALPWDKTLIERDIGRAVSSDRVSLSRAIAGAAETGTLFLVSGADNPSTLNFLPDTHLVVLATGDMTGSYEEAWKKLRGLFGRGEMPRTVTLVSGPSCTADIEQTIVRGAHGPRQLAVFFVP